MLFQLQEITNNAAETAQSWIRRAKEAAGQGKIVFVISKGCLKFSGYQKFEIYSIILPWNMKLYVDQRRLERLLNVEVMMPPLHDPERLSFWVCFSFSGIFLAPVHTNTHNLTLSLSLIHASMFV